MCKKKSEFWYEIIQYYGKISTIPYQMYVENMRFGIESNTIGVKLVYYYYSSKSPEYSLK